MFYTLMYALLTCMAAVLPVFSRSVQDRPLADPTSNVKVKLLKDPSLGDLSMEVDLFWTFQEEGNQNPPKEILLFFDMPLGNEMAEEPKVSNCLLDNHAVSDPQWVKGRGFSIPLTKPLFPGIKVHVEFLFTCRLNSLPDHGILTHFFPRIPLFFHGNWVIPPDYQPAFGYGTCHFLSQDPQFNIIFHDHLRQKNSRNAPLVSNGSSIVVKTGALNTITLMGLEIDYQPEWQVSDLQSALGIVSRVIDFKPYNHIIVLKGTQHAGWGICSAHDVASLARTMLEMFLQTSYPLITPRGLPLYQDLSAWLIQPAPSRWSYEPWPDFKQPKVQLFLDPLACFLNEKPRDWINKMLEDWLNQRSGIECSIEDVFHFRPGLQDESVQVSFIKTVPHGYEYGFNVSALLAPALFLKDIHGGYHLKSRRTRVTEVFPAPLESWQSGFSLSKRGIINIPEHIKIKAQNQKIKNDKLWQHARYQWFF